MSRFYSLIIPVHNRPHEIEEVMACLVTQTYKNFELIVVESGSTVRSDAVVEKYNQQLTIQHLTAGNDGQGFSRNLGMKHALGDYFVILDSDILLDNDYLENLDKALNKNYLDCFGGPDKAHSNFTDFQKAVDHVMTSFLTTGGIRGGDKQVDKFQPRSFNMGFSREVYEKTQGFKLPFFAEDLELSRRIESLGFKTGLIPEAYVYHKRKTNLKGVWKQMHFFGRARINMYLLFPDTLKATHFFPSVFSLYSIFCLLLFFWYTTTLRDWAIRLQTPLLIYIILIVITGVKKYNLKVGLISIATLFTQMFAYGHGFAIDFINRVFFKEELKTKNKN